MITCMRELASPWGIFHIFKIKRQMPRGMSGLGIDWAISIDKLVLLYEQFDYNLSFFSTFSKSKDKCPGGWAGLELTEPLVLINWFYFTNSSIIIYHFFVCVGICRDCRTAIFPDTKITVTEACSSSIAGIAKRIENVSLVSHFNDRS